MLQLACSSEQSVHADDLEIRRCGTTRTIDTVRLLHGTETRPVVLALGDEAARKLPQWVAFPELIRCASFLILKRDRQEFSDKIEGVYAVKSVDRLFKTAGIFYLLDADTPLVSASAIRSYFEQGDQPPSDWLPPKVLDYIIQKNLYMT